MAFLCIRDEAQVVSRLKMFVISSAGKNVYAVARVEK